PYEGVNASVLARDVKQAAERAAESVKAQDPARAERLLGASAHWLRHSHASHALEAGVALTAVQANLGHTSLVTTSVYATTEQSLRMQQMQEFWQQSSGDSDR
ncbi:tyrosine-type recombinase/integrase, partial [Escherichia coli]|uniref:site-specific integrase n=4 Tax=Pseudomonadota TaxID=1224 RepID=UPI0013652CD2